MGPRDGAPHPPTLGHPGPAGAPLDARRRLAALAQRALEPLLVALLVATTVSVTAIGVLTALLAVATVLALGDASWRARFRTPLAAPVLTYAGLTLISASLSVDPGTAFFESKGLLSVIVFFAAVNGFGSASAAARALRWLFGATALVALYALVQTWACRSAVALPDSVGALLRVKLEACRSYPFRAKGFFSTYMTLGGALLITLTMLLATLALGAIRRPLMALGPAALAVMALGFTQVRNAWVGLAVALAVLIALSRRLALVAAALAVLIAVLTVPSSVRTRMLSLLDVHDETAQHRLDFWRAGARMVGDAPWLGLGPGGVRRHYPEYRPEGSARARTGHLHNNVVQVAAEHGLLGLAAWLWIWVAYLRDAIATYRRLPVARALERALVGGSLAAVAGFQVAGLFEYNFRDAEVIHLLWVILALPYVVARDHPGSAAPARPEITTPRPASP
jgi:O-antigen ligase